MGCFFDGQISSLFRDKNTATFNCQRYMPLPLESWIPAIEKVRIFESAKTTPTSSSGSVFVDRICGLFLRHLSNFQLSAVYPRFLLADTRHFLQCPTLC